VKAMANNEAMGALKALKKKPATYKGKSMRPGGGGALPKARMR